MKLSFICIIILKSKEGLDMLKHHNPRPISMDVTVAADTYNYLEFASTRETVPIGTIIDRLVRENQSSCPTTAARQTLEQALTGITCFNSQEIRETLTIILNILKNIPQRSSHEMRMALLREIILLSKREEEE